MAPSNLQAIMAFLAIGALAPAAIAAPIPGTDAMILPIHPPSTPSHVDPVGNVIMEKRGSPGDIIAPWQDENPGAKSGLPGMDAAGLGWKPPYKKHPHERDIIDREMVPLDHNDEVEPTGNIEEAGDNDVDTDDEDELMDHVKERRYIKPILDKGKEKMIYTPPGSPSPPSSPPKSPSPAPSKPNTPSPGSPAPSKPNTPAPGPPKLPESPKFKITGAEHWGAGHSGKRDNEDEVVPMDHAEERRYIKPILDKGKEKMIYTPPGTPSPPSSPPPKSPSLQPPSPPPKSPSPAPSKPNTPPPTNNTPKYKICSTKPWVPGYKSGCD
ncbi:hypothetical protein PG984_015501 [Apiospora sp. TS-2023a]